jgi:Flp pilus assembly protein TadG
MAVTKRELAALIARSTHRPTSARVAPVAGSAASGVRRLGGYRDEHGAAAAFVVLMTVALLSVAGLVIDGGYALGAKREAMTDAEQAARAGADALNQGALRSGEVMVDPGRARIAAQTYLHAVGATGTVRIHGGQVSVTVTTREHTVILSAVGVNTIPIKATATAESIDQNTT